MATEIFIKENIKYKVLSFAINLFLIFGLLFVPESDSLPHFPDWYNQIDMYLTVLLSFPLVFQLHSLFKVTGLKLQSQGIEDHTGRKAQTFLWNEIVSIRFMKMYFLKYILIYVKDPIPYIQKQNAFKKITLKSNLKKFGTPIKIPIHSIDKTPQEILNLILDYSKSISDQNKSVSV